MTDALDTPFPRASLGRPLRRGSHQYLPTPQGGTINPPTVPESEVERITRQIEEGTLKPKPKVTFDKGENVRVISGPFASFYGLVDEVNEEKGRLRVLVSIFGRSTPIELDFIQVEKVA
mgnify:CR=1 FL=1